MSAFFRFIFVFIFGLTLLVIGSAWLGVSFLIPKTLTKLVYEVTGFPAKSSAIVFNPLRPSLGLSSLKISNSKEFETASAFLEVSNAVLVFDPSIYREGTLLVDSVSVVVEQLTCVENSDAIVNFEVFSARGYPLVKALNGYLTEVLAPLNFGSTRSPSGEEGIKLSIKTCRVVLNRVTFVKYDSDQVAQSEDFDVHLDVELYDVEDLASVIAEVLSKTKVLSPFSFPDLNAVDE